MLVVINKKILRIWVDFRLIGMVLGGYWSKALETQVKCKKPHKKYGVLEIRILEGMGGRSEMASVRYLPVRQSKSDSKMG